MKDLEGAVCDAGIAATNYLLKHIDNVVSEEKIESLIDDLRNAKIKLLAAGGVMGPKGDQIYNKTMKELEESLPV